MARPLPMWPNRQGGQVKTLLLNLALVLSSISVSAQELREQLEEFHRDPASYMARLPLKREHHVETPFSQKEIESGDYLLQKDKFRKQLCRMVGARRVCPQLQQSRYAPFAAIESSPQDISTFI